MRTAMALLTCILLVAACGDKEAANAAKKTKLTDVLSRYRVLNGQLAEKMEGWQATLNAVIPAHSAWKRAKGTDGEAAAKQAFDEANAAASDVTKMKRALEIQIRDLKDKIRQLGGKP